MLSKDITFLMRVTWWLSEPSRKKMSRAGLDSLWHCPSRCACQAELRLLAAPMGLGRERCLRGQGHRGGEEQATGPLPHTAIGLASVHFR